MVEFNQCDWFECHETLEKLWLEETGEMRDFYQGILQIAAALHHWRKGNFNGAVTLLARGVSYLRRVRPVCRGVDLSGFISDTEATLDALTELGPSRMANLEPRLIPTLWEYRGDP
jgi:predicted metal-dependent hydrolase